MRHSIILAVLVMLPPAALADAVRVAVMQVGDADTPTNRDGEVQQAVKRALTQLEVEALTPDQSARQLEGNPAARQARQRVAAAIARARKLRRDMEYEKAAEALEGSKQDAIDGLLRFVDSRQLAELHLQRGLLLLPTSPEEARKELRQSFAIHPRPIEARAYSPKILAELRKASAARQRQPAIAEADATKAADALQVAYLILPTMVKDDATTRLQLAVFDAKLRAWHHSTSEDVSIERLVSILRSLLGLPPVAPVSVAMPALTTPASAPAVADDSNAGRPKRPIWPWVAASVGVAAAVVGTALWVVSNDRVSEAEGLAGKDPLLEYAAQPESLESSAHRFRAGAIISLIGAAAAASAAVVGWLSSGRDKPRRKKRADVSISIGASSVFVTFP